MNDFEKILKDKLENYSETPSNEIFQNIRKNYPRKTIGEYISYNKNYLILISAIILIPTLILILSNEPKDNNTKQNQNENTVEINNVNIINHNKKINNEQKLIIHENKANITNQQNTENTSNTQKSEIIFHYNIFNFSDTVICGNEIEITFNGDANNLIIPKNLNFIVTNNKLKIKTDNSGKYKITYKEDDKIDTCQIFFNIISSPNVKLSSDRICKGEEVNVYVNESQNLIINVDKGIIEKINDKFFKIKNLPPGKSRIFFINNKENCKISTEKEIEVLPEPRLKYLSSANICSGNNGRLYVFSEKNVNINNYILNNEIESKTGIFTNLNSGIYTLKIEYGNNCFLYDTLLIKDSLSLIPYFVSEKDIINPKKYYFYNYSKFEDKGYERNKNIKFLWKINNEVVSENDNLEYEFNTNGRYTIVLKAYLSDTNCNAIYSEDIFIEGNCFKIPNIFTPNGDGVGDEFKIKYDGEIVNFNLVILNRVGEIIWNSKDINIGWDGKINGNDDASEGIYYYIIKGEDKTGSKLEQRGVLQLIRH